MSVWDFVTLLQEITTQQKMPTDADFKLKIFRFGFFVD